VVFFRDRPVLAPRWIAINLTVMSCSAGKMRQKVLQKEALTAAWHRNLLDIAAVQYKIRIAAMQQQD